MKEDASIFKWRDYETATCPKCKSGNIARIMYGLPAMDAEYEDALKKKVVTLGGCCISPDYPVYECNDCKEQWGHLDEDKYLGSIFEK